MYVATTTRSRFGDEGRMIFQGKIRCWSFVTNHRPREVAKIDMLDTMEMKTIASFKKKTIKPLTENDIQAIHEKRAKIGTRGNYFHPTRQCLDICSSYVS